MTMNSDQRVGIDRRSFTPQVSKGKSMNRLLWKRLVLTGVAVAALSIPVKADWQLLWRLFRHSGVNFNGWCYGYTIAWMGGRMAPAPLTDEILPAQNTANRLDANVFFYDVDLPGQVILRSGDQWPLVSRPAIDDVADILQHDTWPSPPQGTPQEQFDRYRLWLKNNIDKLVKDQADLEARMAGMRGEYMQPMTVIQFPPRNQSPEPAVAAIPCHNVIVYVDTQHRLWVLDPNDFGHRHRQATFANYILRWQVLGGQGQLVQMSWNNVFITREYVNRVTRGGDPPVYWEWYPDTDWFGDMPDIDFDPSELD
jgi:hypothetical protein